MSIETKRILTVSPSINDEGKRDRYSNDEVSFFGRGAQVGHPSDKDGASGVRKPKGEESEHLETKTGWPDGENDDT